MTITVAPTVASAASTSALPNTSSSQEVLTEGLPSEFASVFSQLVDRFNAFASEGKAKGDAGAQGVLKKTLTSESPDHRPLLADRDIKATASTGEQARQPLSSDALTLEQSAINAASAALQQVVARQEKNKEDAAIREGATPASLDALAALAGFMAPPVPVSQIPKRGESLLGQTQPEASASPMLPGQSLPRNEAPALSPLLAAASSETNANPAETLTPGGKPQQDFSAIFAGAQQNGEGNQAGPTIPGVSPSAAQASATVSGNGPTTPLPGAEARREIPIPVGANGWSTGLGDQVAWMSRSNQQQAQITLNPPNLGPLQITLNLSSDQVTAQFVSPHAEVRQAIQDAMPQLKEMLASSGIALGQSSVGSEPSRQQQDPAPGQRDTSRFQADQAILDGDRSQVVTTPASVIRGGRGMVDLFA